MCQRRPPAAHGEREGRDVLSCGSRQGAGVSIDPEDVVPTRGVGDYGGGRPRRLAAASHGGHVKPDDLYRSLTLLPSFPTNPVEFSLRRGARFTDFSLGATALWRE